MSLWRVFVEICCQNVKLIVFIYLFERCLYYSASRPIRVYFGSCYRRFSYRVQITLGPIIFFHFLHTFNFPVFETTVRRKFQVPFSSPLRATITFILVTRSHTFSSDTCYFFYHWLYKTPFLFYPWKARALPALLSLWLAYLVTVIQSHYICSSRTNPTDECDD